MSLDWSINDTEKGVWLKSCKSQRYQRETKSHEPIFLLIMMLHLFLHGAVYVLINLLIRDLQILYGTEKAVKTLPDRNKHHNMKTF